MIYKFSHTEIDTVNYRISIDRKNIAVKPQVFNLIVYLIENRHRLVMHKEILDEIWHERIVSDASVANHIKSARKVLGDDGQKQKIIKTFHSRGYQFVVEVKEISPQVSKKTDDKTLAIKKNRYKMKFTLSGVILFMLLLLANQLWKSANHQKPKQKQLIHKIAVLPFINSIPHVDTNYFGFAIANQIISELIYLKNIAVRPSGSIQKYTEAVYDPIKVGRELNVDYILTGNYLKQADDIRLNIELIEVSTNKLLWRGEPIKVKYQNIFDIQDIVTQTVINGLEIEFSSNEMKRIRKNISKSPLAYEYYLRGIAYPQTTNGHNLALKMLRKSIALDDSYAPAYVRLGDRIRRLEQFGLTDSGDTQGSEQYYLKALSLNPELMSALAYLSMFYTESNQIEKAVKLARRMSEINPNDANTHFTLGYIYRYAGMAAIAITEMEKAVALDPENPDFRSLMNSYSDNGDFHKAQKLIENYGDNPFTLGWKGLLFFRLGDNTNAIQYFKKTMTEDPHGLWGNISALHIAYLENNHKKALEAIGKLEGTTVSDGEILFYTASYYGLLGESKRCIELLRKAVDNGYFNHTFITSNNYFDNLRDDPEFIKVLNQAKQKHLAFRTFFLKELDQP